MIPSDEGSVPRRRIRVFFASPGDLVVERRVFKEQIDQLNSGFGDGAGIVFVPLGWEDTLATTGRRFQSVINQDIDACDVFVLAMYRRWGQPAPDSTFSSYTEEEFQRALQRFKQTHAPEIFVFFKHVDDASVGDPGPELSKVLKFRRELDDTRAVRWREFAHPAEFGREVDRHLRAFSLGRLPAVASEPERLPLPLELVERVERAEAEARRKIEEVEAQMREQSGAAAAAIQRALAQEARAAALESLLAMRSVTAADKGSMEEARQLFATATRGTTSPQVLYLSFEFFWRAGPLSSAEEILQQWLAVTGQNAQTKETATALSNLAIIYQTRGDLDAAEEMHRKALTIDKQLKRLEQTSYHYSNLGLIYQTRGDLDRAEEMHRKALAVEERFKRREAMSDQFTHLALIQQARGDFTRAEEMHKKALSLYAPVDFDSRQLGIVTLPVVVHVVYHTPAQNISDAQVASQIAVLNKDYRAGNDDISLVPYAFRRAIGDARIEFRLATKDPQGQPTNGITRTHTQRSSFEGDRVKRGASGGIDPWDTERYLNIWVCSLQGGLVGFAQFPGGRRDTDGVVINTTAFGTVGSATAPFNKGRTTTHTIGHYLDLRHPWGGEASAADLPPHSQPNFGSPSFPHISGNNGPHGDMFVNFMDYVDDDAMHMFTKGQVLRMHATLQGPRENLAVPQSKKAGASRARTHRSAAQ